MTLRARHPGVYSSALRIATKGDCRVSRSASTIVFSNSSSNRRLIAGRQRSGRATSDPPPAVMRSRKILRRPFYRAFRFRHASNPTPSTVNPNVDGSGVFDVMVTV